MSFVRRLIDTTFTLGEGTFGDTGGNTSKLSGLRTQTKIVKAGGISMGALQMQIWGMPLSMMNKLSTLGMAVQLVRRNTVVVEAGDEGSSKTTVFSGTIQNAWFDAQGAPDVMFHIEAQIGLIDAVSVIAPTSYTGNVDVATIMASLASKMGYAFENSGVSVMLSHPYFSGSPRNQAAAAAKAANIEWVIDNGTLAIWPKGQARGSEIPLISKATGMVGYPTYTSKGVMVKTAFNPAIAYGQKIRVESSLGATASGEWIVYGLDYDLDSLLPGGNWFCSISAARPGLGPIIQ